MNQVYNRELEPIKFSSLIREEKAVICNGCGPKGGVVPVPNFCFLASCNHHDFNYWLGCTRKDRKRADKQFYRAMKTDAADYPEPTRRRYMLWAWIYYCSVRLFGGPCFNFKAKRTWTDLKKAMAKHTASHLS